ncbi:MAG: response regulator [Candidatus Omnitrophica bacterium]|nr:response regulator [Candidatus Omnitrophota bacterium]MDE2213774.1 response regulator [Candidatus Omnitrophota bacterium]MDE2230650.1 response regulator [Candidatus Omnitrophota bacterium]
MSGPKTILVIDDEVNLQVMVKMTLETKQYKVLIAGNGLEGLEQLKTVKPDLIILDMNMPKMGGLEFYQRICENDKPKYPVLVLTARANMEQLFKQFNIDGFMSKPFEIDDLLKEVEAILGRHAGEGVKMTSSGASETRKVCVVENNQEILNQIGGVFLSAGYTVNPARNGVDGIERIAATVPDIALIKLGLVDISGDIVIAKLKNMAKTRDVKCILYTEKGPEKTVIAQKIGEKQGVDRFLEYTAPGDFLDAARELLG